MKVPRIDSHQHFWRLERGDYRWLTPELTPLYRDFEPAHLAPELARGRIDATIAVQAAESAAETDHLLALAEESPWIAGVVGWIDFEAPDACAEIARRSLSRHFVGVRPMLQDLGDERWMLRSELTPVFEALEASGLAFDALVRPRHLAHLVEVVRRHPRLRVVIDHGGKPEIANGMRWAGFARWRDELGELARAGACVKLSGLLTEASPGAGERELAPFVDVLLEEFGPQRILWGSDWPVVLCAAGHAHWLELSARLLRRLSVVEREGVFGGNAVVFYRLRSFA